MQAALTAELTRLEALANQREHEVHALKRELRDVERDHGRELRTLREAAGSEALTKATLQVEALQAQLAEETAAKQRNKRKFEAEADHLREETEKERLEKHVFEERIARLELQVKQEKEKAASDASKGGSTLQAVAGGAAADVLAEAHQNLIEQVEDLSARLLDAEEKKRWALEDLANRCDRVADLELELDKLKDTAGESAGNSGELQEMRAGRDVAERKLQETQKILWSEEAKVSKLTVNVQILQKKLERKKQEEEARKERDSRPSAATTPAPSQPKPAPHPPQPSGGWMPSLGLGGFLRGGGKDTDSDSVLRGGGGGSTT